MQERNPQPWCVSHLIFPDEVQTLAVSKAAAPGLPEGRMASREVLPSPEIIDRAVRRLRDSRRPVIIVGHGARFQMAPVIDLAEALSCPIITTFKGKGLISDQHPLAGGVLGRSGTPVASWAMNEADCLLVLGASFSNHTGITPKIPTIQVDFDLMTLGKFHAVEVPVWGEIGLTVRLLEEGVASAHRAADQRSDMAERWKIWRREKQRRTEDDRGKGLNSALVFEAMSRIVPDNAIMTVDVGNNTYSFGRYFECAQQAILMSGYLGSIGFSYPAAMGAWAASQEADPAFAGRPVVSVSGDGGFGQYMAEVTTAVKYDMNITHILLRNDELGKIFKEQRAGSWDVWQTSLHNPPFAEYASLCGALGIQVKTKRDLDGAISRALAHEGPSLVEVSTDVELI